MPPRELSIAGLLYKTRTWVNRSWWLNTEAAEQLRDSLIDAPLRYAPSPDLAFEGHFWDELDSQDSIIGRITYMYSTPDTTPGVKRYVAFASITTSWVIEAMQAGRVPNGWSIYGTMRNHDTGEAYYARGRSVSILSYPAFPDARFTITGNG